MIVIIAFVFAALGAVVSAIVGSVTARAAREKDRKKANHHRQLANELTNKYAHLEKKYHDLADDNKKLINDFNQLNHQGELNKVEKDNLRLAVQLQQNLLILMWEIDTEPTTDTLKRFQAAVEQTNQVLEQLQEELIVVPEDYYESLSTKIAATKPVNTVKSNNAVSKNLLSIDLGRTSTKICVSREPSSVVFISANVKQIPFAQIRENIFEHRATDPFMDLWMEHQGKGYAVGQLAFDLGAHLGVGQSKVEDALVKVLTAAGYFKLKDEISVVISLPFFSPEQFEIEKARLISTIAGPHVMNFRGEPVYLNISKVWVMPEGYGSLLWCESQPKKEASCPDFTKTSVAIVDIGYESMNMLIADNFRLDEDASKSEYFGTSKLYELLAAEIEGADSQSLKLITAVHKPKGERFYIPKGAIKPTNLDNFLPNLIEMFSREISSRVLAWLPEQVTDVIITGGDGEYFWEDIQRLLKEATKISVYLAAPSRQVNALGQYIYGEAQFSAAHQQAHNQK